MFRTDDENREHNARMSNPVAALVARDGYGWPGGYELFAMTDAGRVLCFDCCKTNYRRIVTSDGSDGWHVTRSLSTANEVDPVACDHCNRQCE